MKSLAICQAFGQKVFGFAGRSFLGVRRGKNAFPRTKSDKFRQHLFSPRKTALRKSAVDAGSITKRG
jgi:hypothetical protein